LKQDEKIDHIGPYFVRCDIRPWGLLHAITQRIK
jgi:hypothetical protein